VLELVSAHSSPQNGNICGQGRRLSPISTSTSANRESGDKIECAKSPDSRPIPASLVELGLTHEWVAVGVVPIAPVSEVNSRQTGNFSGKVLFFCRVMSPTSTRDALHFSVSRVNSLVE
jgi:hypothetical protein